MSLLFQTHDGKTPLHMTAVNGRFTRAQTLINNGMTVYVYIQFLFDWPTFLIFS